MRQRTIQSSPRLGSAAPAAAALTLIRTINAAAFAITPPASPSLGALLFVRLTQDGTGHTVAWDAAFENPPDIQVAASLKSSMLFAGTGTAWVLAGVPVLNQ